MEFISDMEYAYFNGEPECLKCDDCGNAYNSDLFVSLESDTCHNCQYYNGDISEDRYRYFSHEFDEHKKTLQEAMA